MRINIVTPPHTQFAAICLANTLTELGHDAYMIDHIDVKENSLHIIYCAALHFAMPKNYIIYQTEVHTSHWFNQKYLGFINKAKAVWEYQEPNKCRYDKLNKNIHIVPPSVLMQPPQKKDIELLFYGTLNKRREAILNEIGRQVKVDIVTNTLQREMWQLLARSKKVINIHHYDNAPLELFRVNEALSFGCNVVSEPSIGCERYRKFISIGETTGQLIQLCKQPYVTQNISSLEVKPDYIKSLIAQIKDIRVLNY